MNFKRKRRLIVRPSMKFLTIRKQTKIPVSIVLGLCIVFMSMLTAQEAKKEQQEISLEDLLNTKIDTAAKYEQTIMEAAASVAIITSEDIDRFGWLTLSEVLHSLQGFFISNDRNYEYSGVRGFGRPTDYNNRVLVQINGHSINENVYGSTPVGTDLSLDLNSVQRIEVVFGPGSALYGTGAMFAVVNVITKKGDEIDGFHLSAETGSFGRLRTSLSLGKRFDNGLDLAFTGLWADVSGQDLYFQEFDDPATNNGIAESLDGDKYYGFNSTLKYKNFSLQGSFWSRKKQIPTASYDMNFNDNRAATLDELGFIEMKYKLDLNSKISLNFSGYFNNYYYKGWYPYDSVWIDLSKGKWIGSEFQLNWETRANNKLVLGIEYQYHFRASYKAWDDTEEYFDFNYPYHAFSFYLQDEYQALKNLSFILGIRYDYYSDVGDSFSPRIAAVYNISNSSTVKLLLGSAFRKPSIFETYYEEPDWQKINLNLAPEKIRTVELVWQHKLNRNLFGFVSLFNYRMTDLIDLWIDPEDELFQYINLNKVNANGIETGLNFRLDEGLMGTLSYSFQNAKDFDSKQKLSNSPNHMLKAKLSVPVLNYFRFSAQFFYETSRFTVYETQTESHILTHVNLTTIPLFNHFKLSFLVRNLFNTTYAYPAGLEHWQEAIIQDGRNFILRMEFLF